MIQDLDRRVDRPSFGIIRPVHQAFQPRMHHGARAHGTRLNCSKQFTRSQPVVTDVCTRFAQRDNFRMGRGIGVREISIPAAAYDFSVANYHRAYGHFARFEGTLRRPQSLGHPKFIGDGRWIRRSLIVSCSQVPRHELIVTGCSTWMRPMRPSIKWGLISPSPALDGILNPIWGCRICCAKSSYGT